MLSSFRARIVALLVAIVIAALAVNALVNRLVARTYNNEAIGNNLAAIQIGHVDAIAEWVASHNQMVNALQDAALQEDPVPALQLVAAAGGSSRPMSAIPTRASVF